MDSDLLDLMETNRFPYLHAKAELFLRIGHEKYIKEDAFGDLMKNITLDRISKIEEGCRQILNFKGLTPLEPFHDIDVEGFYDLMRIFHFLKL